MWPNGGINGSLDMIRKNSICYIVDKCVCIHVYSNAANYTTPVNRKCQYETKSAIISNSLLIFGLNYCKKQKTDIIDWFSVSGADLHI